MSPASRLFPLMAVSLGLLMASSGCNRPPSGGAQTSNAGSQSSTPSGESARNSELEKKLADQQKEIEQLKNKLDGKQSGTGSEAGYQQGQTSSGTNVPGSSAGNPSAQSHTSASSHPEKKIVPITLTSGTHLNVILQNALTTRTNQGGDRFTAHLAAPLEIHGEVILPRDTRFTGHLEESVTSGRVKGRARMSLTLDSFEYRGDIIRIATSSVKVEAGSQVKRDAAIVGGGAGVGAIVGAIVGGKKGAGIGALVGGGAGTATVLSTKGKEVEFPAETRLRFVLDRDVTLQHKR